MKIKVITKFSEQALETHIQNILDNAEAVHQTTFTTVYDDNSARIEYTAYIMYTPQ